MLDKIVCVLDISGRKELTTIANKSEDFYPRYYRLISRLLTKIATDF
jgi:hypothetical protein